MPAWLVEGDPTVYCLLALSLIVSLAMWWRTRRRRWAFAAGIAAALMAGYFLLDRYVESDREQMERKVREIADGVRAHDFDRVFRNVSDSFQRGGLDKKGFRGFVERVSRDRNVTEFKAWDFAAGDIDRAKRRAELEFHFKVQGNWSGGSEFFLARTVWVLDPGNEWRLQTFEIYNPYSDTNAPMFIPGWGSR